MTGDDAAGYGDLQAWLSALDRMSAALGKDYDGPDAQAYGTGVETAVLAVCLEIGQYCYRRASIIEGVQRSAAQAGAVDDYLAALGGSYLASSALGSLGGVVGTDGGVAARQTFARAAAEEGGLSLPFNDAGLRSQVDYVVAHFDEFGKPPTGVQQGGLRGQPAGTYGGQGLPPRPLGYYTESDVWASGAGVKRGAERLVFGQGGEVYYTPTHYNDFVRIR
jgi:hypothetical protein